jgi:hypothetical protein
MIFFKLLGFIRFRSQVSGTASYYQITAMCGWGIKQLLAGVESGIIGLHGILADFFDFEINSPSELYE